LTIQDLRNIHVWLRSARIDADAAREFIGCVERLEATIQKVTAEAQAAAEKAPGIPTTPPGPITPEMHKASVVSSETPGVKGNKRIQRHVKGILRESQKLSGKKA
jgi:hypothetical protein